MSAPSPRQAEILAFIRESLRTRGISPTRWEIAKRIGLKSVGPVNAYVDALIKKGYLRKQSGVIRCARGLVPVKPSPDDPLQMAAEIVVETPDGEKQRSWLFGRGLIFAPDGAKIHIATPGFHRGPRNYRPPNQIADRARRKKRP